MRFGSLFSGVGGFDLGLERAGMECAWTVEYDPQARSVLRRHWPDVDHYEDVRNVGPDQLVPVDLICGGFPCQDLSVAGRREGLDGARSGLWHEFRRIVGEMLPRWVLVENVPGLLSSNGGADFAVVLRGLAELGYVGAWRVLDSRHFGVAQRRRRVFLLACRDPGAIGPAEVLAIPEGLSGHPAPGREARTITTTALTGGSGSKGGPDDNAAQGHQIVAHPLQEIGKRTGKSTSDPRAGIGIGGNGDPMYTLQAGAIHGVAHTLTGEGHDAHEDGTGRGTPIVPVLAFDWQSGGDARGLDGSVDRTNALHVGQTPAVLAFDTTQITSPGNYSNPKPGDPCHPLAAGAHAPAVANTPQTVPRRLTPRECERLQGFPDDWTAWGVDDDGERVDMSDSPRYRMMGNAVTVSVAEWIGRRLMETLA